MVTPVGLLPFSLFSSRIKNPSLFPLTSPLPPPSGINGNGPQFSGRSFLLLLHSRFRKACILLLYWYIARGEREGKTTYLLNMHEKSFCALPPCCISPLLWLVEYYAVHTSTSMYGTCVEGGGEGEFLKEGLFNYEGPFFLRVRTLKLYL